MQRKDLKRPVDFLLFHFEMRLFPFQSVLRRVEISADESVKGDVVSWRCDRCTLDALKKQSGDAFQQLCWPKLLLRSRAGDR